MVAVQTITVTSKPNRQPHASFTMQLVPPAAGGRLLVAIGVDAVRGLLARL
jgi:hypothetical protein